MNTVSNKGKLIAISGIDGSGKSTVAEKLRQHLQECHGNNFVIMSKCVKEPIYSGELWSIKNNLNIPKEKYFSKQFKVMVWVADIILNSYNWIIPALENGTHVILDRYTIDHKVFCEVLTEEKYHCITNVLDFLPQPDLGIYLDANVNTAIQRIIKRNKKKAGHETPEMLNIFRNTFLSTIDRENYRIEIIDANRNPNDIFADVLAIINTVIGLSSKN